MVDGLIVCLLLLQFLVLLVLFWFLPVMEVGSIVGPIDGSKVKSTSDCKKLKLS